MKNKEIIHLLSALLYEHDCVIIPGFGGFVARYHSARVLQSVFVPPSKSILFNRNLSNNDGLLANKIMEVEGVSFEKANQVINDFVVDNLSMIHTKRRLEFFPLGFFYFNTENILQFEPSSDVNYLIESFGLPNVIAQPLLKTEQAQKVIFKDREVRTITPKKRKYRQMAALLVGLPLVAAFFFFTGKTVADKNISFADFNFFNGAQEAKYTPLVYKKNNSAFEFPKKEINSTPDSSGLVHYQIEGDSTVEVLVKAMNPILPESTAVKNNREELEKVANVSSKLSGTYQVVVGCFANENNAQNLLSKLKSQNFPALIVGKNKNGLTVVSIGGFDSVESAKDYTQEIKSQFSGAWVLNKNTL